MGRIVEQPIEEELRNSYLDYAMSVIIGRALPDVRDGLKPVHRRVLYSMHELGVTSSSAFKKSARIVGDCLGKYHPHGDSAVYDALVRMAQPFSLRYPLVEGQGNFGSIDGDSAAAMRYTEARISKIGEELLKDLEKDTVDFVPNFDGSLKEPVVLPTTIPQLLINGSSGIAVGMATNIPPHNINEVCDAIVETINNPNITILELSKIIRGPDFPTGATIINQKGIYDYFHTGYGKLILRSKAHFEEKKNKKLIVITEIPYQVNKSSLIEQIAELVKRGTIDGISNIRDESNKEGIRIVFELKQGVNEDIILNQLYKHSQLQVTFGVQLRALDGKRPKVFNIKQLIEKFIDFRKEVIKRRTAFDLKKAEDRLHIVEGLIIAQENLDDVVKLIRASESVEEAKSSLISRYSLTEIQAKAILEMRLQKLTKLERTKLKDEETKLKQTIEELRSILESEQKVLDIIKKETLEIKQRYGDERRTDFNFEEDVEIDFEDLIEDKPWVIMISNKDYIKRSDLEEYKVQRRGGKGVIGAKLRDEDNLKDIFIANSKDYLLVFTNKGRVKWLKVYQVPEGSRQSRGKPLTNLLKLDEDETAKAVIPLKELEEGFLVFATKKGLIKKTALKRFSTPRSTGIIAIKLREHDELIDVKLSKVGSWLFMFTKQGQAIRFNEAAVRETGRNSMGVKGITLQSNDEVVSLQVSNNESDSILTITSEGFGKRTEINEYRITNRGGKGIRNIKLSDKNGYVIGCEIVNDEDELLVVTLQGNVIRVNCSEIPVYGRNSSGVRIIRLSEGDKVISFSKIAK
ncbi:MAG: gyrase subunit [Candidatus Woesearchaeota archaeon]|nr:gyrase subunit [Candidatus Woesearchaeota archaeon]MDN5327792.1 gyrase subunit [Candidatus Woesearchaeota archaeon]